MSATQPPLDLLFRVRGTVQGVGYRPFVLRLANELGVKGWVRNDSHGVLVRAVGEEQMLDRLAELLVSRAPFASRVTGVERIESAQEDKAYGRTFEIIESTEPAPEVETAVPIDAAPCADCRRELFDARDRRAGYPFINCTQCGPRYSIIEQLPYDRPRTTMRCFKMCPECESEYRDPRSRRFHAEPIACPVCGPHLELSDPKGKVLGERENALSIAASALRSGRIVAAKGAGGFHLMADATDEVAVAELRRRKHREEKAFAVMFRDVCTLRLWADVHPEAQRLLESARCPVVLLPKRPQPSLAPSVAPGNPWIGAMLPSTPLHMRLMALVDRPLVATSANLSDEPLCTEDAEARARLAGIADLFLGHNRGIARPVDDSVVRFTDSREPILLRRARGYAPVPLGLPGRMPRPTLCVGAQMKNSVAVASGDRVVLSPHIGDLGGALTQAVFSRTISMLGSVSGGRIAQVICDKHPDYASTRHAEASGLPCTRVQHHLAHVLAILLEHKHPADDVLGVAWDGTGYGEDGTIWGGEFILVSSGRASRFARLRPFRLPGGEAAVRDSRRVAVALGDALGPGRGARIARDLGFRESDAANLVAMLAQGINSPVCSSMGRLFDGMGALLGLGRWNTYEGQTPLAVEIAARRAPHSRGRLPFGVARASEGAEWEIDWRPAIESVLDGGVGNAAEVAAAFHRGLVGALVEVACLSGAKSVALGGGCFQNALLRGLADQQLASAGFRVLNPVDLPPNDGAIAAGQALGALWNLTTVETPSPVSDRNQIPCALPYQEK